jgi:hypothetical protein
MHLALSDENISSPARFNWLGEGVNCIHAAQSLSDGGQRGNFEGKVGVKLRYEPAEESPCF